MAIDPCRDLRDIDLDDFLLWRFLNTGEESIWWPAGGIGYCQTQVTSKIIVSRAPKRSPFVESSYVVLAHMPVLKYRGKVYAIWLLLVGDLRSGYKKEYRTPNKEFRIPRYRHLVIQHSLFDVRYSNESTNTAALTLHQPGCLPVRTSTAQRIAAVRQRYRSPAFLSHAGGRFLPFYGSDSGAA